jgi:hypothetical protein
MQVKQTNKIPSYNNNENWPDYYTLSAENCHKTDVVNFKYSILRLLTNASKLEISTLTVLCMWK